MATVKTLVSGQNKLIVNITEDFTTADESDVVVIDRSALIGPDGVNPPSKIKVDEITWAVNGYNYVELEWADDTDERIEFLTGQGYMDYRPFGGKSPSAAPSAATDGDIALTTNGGASGDTYSILLHCTLKV